MRRQRTKLRGGREAGGDPRPVARADRGEQLLHDGRLDHGARVLGGERPGDGVGVAAPWLGAVDDLHRLAGHEDHHRRQGEDAVARGHTEVDVDVELCDSQALPVLAADLQEQRLDRLARPTPRRRELDEHRDIRLEDLGGERRVRDVEHYTLPRSAFQRSTGTCRIASRTIAPLIFDSPTRRSTNTIGISTTRKPARSARYVPSIWKP